MSATPMHWETDSYYYSGQGVVLIGGRDVNGRPTGLIPVGNVSDLKITISTGIVEHKDSQDGQRATDKRINSEVKSGLAMTLQSWSSANLTLAVRGTSNVITAGTVASSASESVTAYSGAVSPLKYAMVSAVTVSDGTVVLTAWNSTMTSASAWDYQLNADHGSLQFNSTVSGLVQGGGVLANATFATATPPALPSMSVTVAYDYAAQYNTDSLTTGIQERFMRFEGLNTAEDNQPVVIEVFKFSIDPLKELAMISDTFAQFVLEGSVLRDGLQLTGSKYFRTITLQ